MLSLLLFFALVNRYNNLVQKLLKISQQTFWQIVVKAITTTSGFIIIGIISRNYGQSGVGDFTLALIYLTFFYTLADFGFNAHVLSRLQGTGYGLQIEWRKLLGVRIIWSLVLAISAVLLLLVMPSSFTLDFKLSTLFGSLIILFFAMNLTSSALFQSKLRYDLDIVPTIVGVLLSVLVTILFASQHFPIYTLILSYVVAWFIHALGTYLASKKFINNLTPLFDLNYLKNLFKSTWPLAGTLILNIVYFRIDSFILTANFGSAQVGLYNIAYQVFQSILVLPTFIMNSFYPFILQSKKFSFKKPLLGLLGIAISITIFLYYLSPFLIRLIAGSGFTTSITSLQILSLGLPAFFVSSLLWWVLISKGFYKKLLVIYTIGLVFNIVTNLIFVPQYGLLAASWITGLSEYLILTLQIMVLWRK